MPTLLKMILIMLAMISSSTQAGDTQTADSLKVETPDQEGKRPFSISEETTYLVEPVHAKGYIDYAATLNAKGKSIKPEDNAALPLYLLDCNKVENDQVYDPVTGQLSGSITISNSQIETLQRLSGENEPIKIAERILDTPRFFHWGSWKNFRDLSAEELPLSSTVLDSFSFQVLRRQSIVLLPMIQTRLLVAKQASFDSPVDVLG